MSRAWIFAILFLASCQGKLSWSTLAIPLNSCKTSNWQSGAKYYLTQDIVDVTGNCFEINAPYVILDGNGHSIISAKRKEFAYHSLNNVEVCDYTLETCREINYPSPERIWSVQTMDFNNDGYLDLSTTQQSKYVQLFLNDKNTSFEFSNDNSSAPKLSDYNNIHAMQFKDFDQDGDMDWIGIGDFSNRYHYSYGDGLGGFSKVITAVGTAPIWAHRMLANNWDSNSILSLVASYDSDQFTTTVFDFSTFSILSDTRYGGELPGQTSDFFSVDLNKDEFLDLVGVNTNTSTQLMLNPGSGPPIINTLSDKIVVDVADFDNNGRADLLMNPVSLSFVEIVTPYSTDAGGLVINTDNSTFPAAMKALKGLTADYNNDGLTDFFGVLAGKVVFYQNNGAFEFTTIPLGISLTKVVNAHFRDYNKDGYLDVILVATTPPEGVNDVSLFILTNNGNNTFSTNEIALNYQYGNVWPAADVSSGKSFGILVSNQSNVVVQNFRNIQDFSVGVGIVKSNNVLIDNALVNDPDLAAIALDNSDSIQIKNSKSRNLFIGNGFHALNTTNISLNNTRFCPYEKNDYSIATQASGAYCLNSTFSSDSQNNTASINNGCRLPAGVNFKFCGPSESLGMGP